MARSSEWWSALSIGISIALLGLILSLIGGINVIKLQKEYGKIDSYQCIIAERSISDDYPVNSTVTCYSFSNKPWILALYLKAPSSQFTGLLIIGVCMFSVSMLIVVVCIVYDVYNKYKERLKKYNKIEASE